MLGIVVTGLIFGILILLFIGAFSILIAAKYGKVVDNRSLLTVINFSRKVTWRGFFEANMRAKTGKPLDRPYGAKGAVFNWDKIQFNPVYFKGRPLDPDTVVNTEVTLGPMAQKPLTLNIPIIIGGMAYGSGYSLKAKIALAKAASLSGTAANTGNGPFLIEERTYADKLIIQYTRGFWSKTEDILKQADMIEIALGHSARGSAPVRVKGKKITKEVAARYGTIPGLEVLMEAQLPEVQDAAQWKTLVGRLKEITGGVPISVKFGASHYLEKEMALFIAGGIDVLAFDGLEGGTHGGMPLFMDDLGLPILPALCRAVTYLRDNGLKDKVSLIVGGGLARPGDFAKCLALGADAILVGTITALAMSHTQTTKTVPWEPPTGLLYNDGKEKNKYDPDLGAKHLHYYFQSCIKEMQLLARTLGKASFKDFESNDLVALDPQYAKIAGIEYFLPQ